jgi:nicotinate-nucleotide adenylyltransferase
MTKIALFGTSADPPTLGHYAILAWLAQHYAQVAVWTADNPFKSHFSDLGDRLEMLQLLIKELTAHGLNNVQYYPQLSHLRSLITVENAENIFPQNTEFFLVIGSDLITQIPHWYKCQELLKKVNLLIIPRSGFSINQNDLDKLTNLGAKYTISSFTPPEISSSLYREFKQDNLLTNSVKSYIHDHKLY